MRLIKLMDPTVIRRLFWAVLSPFTGLLLRIHNVSFSRSRLYGIPAISNEGSISLGRNVDLFSTNAYYVTAALVPRCLLKTYSRGRIIIEDNVKLHGTAIVSSKKVHIGENTMIGANCVILDTDIHPIDPLRRTEVCSEIVKSAPVIIGKNVFIGVNVTILKGVIIGDNSVVGAGSVVTADVAPNSIAAGNPAKIIRGI